MNLTHSPGLLDKSIWTDQLFTGRWQAGSFATGVIEPAKIGRAHV